MTQTVIGCDPHLDTITACVIELGTHTEVTIQTVANTVEGRHQLLVMTAELGVVKVGIEGASGHGLCLARDFDQQQVPVDDIPTRLTARRRRVSGPGKTDPGDARTIARATANGEGHPWIYRPELETIRVLWARREHLVCDQSADINHLRALLTEIDPGLAAQLKRVRSAKTLQRFTIPLTLSNPNRHTQAVADIICDIARTCLDRHTQIRQYEKTLQQVMPPAGHDLQQHQGCGLINTTTILSQIAGTRFQTEAQFAAWAGVACLDVSSGRQQHHRLNRGGNRQVNRALHTIILTQARHHGPAHHYIQQRQQQGKTTRQAIRTAKRHLARKIYRTLRQHNLT